MSLSFPRSQAMASSGCLRSNTKSVHRGSCDSQFCFIFHNWIIVSVLCIWIGIDGSLDVGYAIHFRVSFLHLLSLLHCKQVLLDNRLLYLYAHMDIQHCLSLFKLSFVWNILWETDKMVQCILLMTHDSPSAPTILSSSVSSSSRIVLPCPSTRDLGTRRAVLCKEQS